MTTQEKLTLEETVNLVKKVPLGKWEKTYGSPSEGVYKGHLGDLDIFLSATRGEAMHSFLQYRLEVIYQGNLITEHGGFDSKSRLYTPEEKEAIAAVKKFYEEYHELIESHLGRNEDAIHEEGTNLARQILKKE